MLLSSLFAIFVIFSPPAPLEKTEILFFKATVNDFEKVKIQSVEDIQAFNIDPTKPVKVICHGLLDDINSFWYDPIRDAYLQSNVTNLIFVDWSVRSQSTTLNAMKSVQAVGEVIADVILKVSWVHKIPLENFHLIGHSLGAHISGFAGKTIYQQTKKKVGRITGLDPAGPTFRQISATRRLSKGDATFVDVIHTDLYIFGIFEILGDVDFYSNIGVTQNGCSVLSNCSHLRAPLYFIESITQNTSFPAWKCSSYILFTLGICSKNSMTHMGEYVNTKATGAYYLQTRSVAPYGIITS